MLRLSAVLARSWYASSTFKSSLCRLLIRPSASSPCLMARSSSLPRLRSITLSQTPLSLSMSETLSFSRVTRFWRAAVATSSRDGSPRSLDGDLLPVSLGAGDTVSLWWIVGAFSLADSACCDNSSVSLDGFLDSLPDLVVYSCGSSVGVAVLSWCCARPDRPVHVVLGRGLLVFFYVNVLYFSGKLLHNWTRPMLVIGPPFWYSPLSVKGLTMPAYTDDYPRPSYLFLCLYTGVVYYTYTFVSYTLLYVYFMSRVRCFP